MEQFGPTENVEVGMMRHVTGFAGFRNLLMNNHHQTVLDPDAELIELAQQISPRNGS